MGRDRLGHRTLARKNTCNLIYSNIKNLRGSIDRSIVEWQRLLNEVKELESEIESSIGTALSNAANALGDAISLIRQRRRDDPIDTDVTALQQLYGALTGIIDALQAILEIRGRQRRIEDLMAGVESLQANVKSLQTRLPNCATSGGQTTAAVI